ncbi:aldehyde dehydrogenase family protein [Streptomyces sp. AC555_RSS877]|uniref:aldehyde dehydrogenase family protein n=1 Tax=Streptomyces sp. AC555_RSS877 TaxID=2823688 RepID=UPI0027E4BB26|nr:aldehyde dehydrogenase family protein [Streptomyces sp. AC555_RSS877]
MRGVLLAGISRLRPPATSFARYFLRPDADTNSHQRGIELIDHLSGCVTTAADHAELTPTGRLVHADPTAYGLSAYVYGETPHTLELGHRPDAGSVSVNCSPGAAPDAPLGGRGLSGYGYEGGEQGLLACGSLKLVQHLGNVRCQGQEGS